jgi:hypothetical protein
MNVVDVIVQQFISLDERRDVIAGQIIDERFRKPFGGSEVFHDARMNRRDQFDVARLEIIVEFVRFLLVNFERFRSESVKEGNICRRSISFCSSSVGSSHFVLRKESVKK